MSNSREEVKAPRFMSYEEWLAKHPEEAEPDPNCKDCKGSGVVEQDCYECNGAGECYNCGAECEACDGTGTFEEPCSCCDARSVYNAIRQHEEAAWSANDRSTVKE